MVGFLSGSRSSRTAVRGPLVNDPDQFLALLLRSNILFDRVSLGGANWRHGPPASRMAAVANQSFG